MMRAQVLDQAQRRIAIIRLGGIALCAILAGRAGQLTVYNYRAVDLGEQQIHTEQQLSPARGAIVDRDGRELALTVQSASVYAIPKLMKDRAAAAREIAASLGLAAGTIEKRLREHENFTYLARWVDSAKVEDLKAKSIEGVGIDPEPRRSYPAGKLAAAVIGFANIDGVGVRGIEQIENAWLTGRPRSVDVERDAKGRALALHATDPREVEGGEVALTLDAAMQAAAESALADALEEHDAKGGLVLTLDPRSGDLLALAEAPGFDPNRFRELDYAETRARSFSDVVEAGSTMKIFLAASALDNGDIDPSTLLDTGTGRIKVPGKLILDRDPFGVLTPADMLRVSSNVGAVQVAQRMGAEAQHRGLSRFGFGRPTASGFPTESAGILRGWERWRPVDQATVAFGQGISVTPIQLAVALASIANDGMRMQPRLVLARRPSSQAPWEPTGIVEAGRAISPESARLTLDMMRTVVSPTGTGRLAGLAGVAVAGKTGTAQKLDVETGHYSQSRYIAWFVGIVPADDPELAIVVAVDEPGGHAHTGGLVAAPLFARVAAAQLARRGIVTEPQPIAPPRPATLVATAEPAPSADPSDSSEAAQPSDPAGPAPVSAAPRSIDELPREAAIAAPPARPAADPAAGPTPRPQGLLARADSTAMRATTFVPDFTGHDLASAQRMAESESLTLSTLGAIEGRVVSQMPAAGSVVHGSERTIRLKFARGREEG